MNNAQTYKHMGSVLLPPLQAPEAQEVYWGRVLSQSGDAFLLSPLKVSTAALGLQVGKLQEQAREGGPESFPLLSSCLDGSTFKIILLNQ